MTMIELDDRDTDYCSVISITNEENTSGKV